jgi:hypothetical protein
MKYKTGPQNCNLFIFPRKHTDLDVEYKMMTLGVFIENTSTQPSII